MSEIHAVLLIPEEGDPLGLLKGGRCGSRPPKAWRQPDGQRWRHGHQSPNEGYVRALVLAWGGVPVRAAAPWLQSRQRNRWIGTVTDLLNNTTPIPSDLAVLEEAGTILFLDADNIEVTP